MDSRLDLDHVAVVVGDLDRAQTDYERMGFRLTPRSSHSGPLPDGTTGPWGTGNHCAMFGTGYFEILGVTDPSRHKTHIDRRLAAYEGLHLVAFGTEDAASAVAELRTRGATLTDPAELGRDVPYGSGTRPGRFAISNLDGDIYPEADFIVIEQKTRDVLWQETLLEHPNGAKSLAGVTIHATDPDDFVERMTAVLGPAGSGGFRLRSGVLDLASHSALGRRFPGCRPPVPGPCVCAVTIGVDDLDRTRALLTANGVDAGQTDRNSLFVLPGQACGAIVEFAPVAAVESWS